MLFLRVSHKFVRQRLPGKSWEADSAKPTFIYRPAGTLNGRRAITSPRPLVLLHRFSGNRGGGRDLVPPSCTKFEATAPGLTIELAHLQVRAFPALRATFTPRSNYAFSA